MGLCMVMGGSGAGKTEYIYRKIIELSMKEPDGRFFVVTPEQATMQAQKEIVRLHPNHGTMNIDVVSFERLAYRIFSDSAAGGPGRYGKKYDPAETCGGEEGRTYHVFVSSEPPGVYRGDQVHALGTLPVRGNSGRP